jgi:hypothetical protein
MYLIIIFINIILSISVYFIDNQELIDTQHVFFIIQALSMALYILKKIKYVYQLLTPSLFVLVYYMFSFCLGSYFSPRGYGFITKDFYINDLLEVQNYSLIISYLLLVNTMLFYATVRTLSISVPLNEHEKPTFMKENSDNNLKIFGLFILFLIVSNLPFFGQFGFQYAIVILICIALKERTSFIKLSFYIPLFVLFMIFNHENKREIILMALSIMALESVFSNSRLILTFKNICTYTVTIVILVILIISSSLLRGYGEYGEINTFQAILLIPQYVGSDVFIDAVMDNFEVSSVYPSVVLPIEYILTGKMELIFGQSIIKPLFLMIPREAFPAKPESIITLFTNTQAPSFFLRGGSLPVAFPGELFINFHIFGIPFFYLLISMFNYFYRQLTTLNCESLKFKMYAATSLSIFIFIRGGGFDLYSIFVMSTFVILTISSTSHHLKIRLT